MALKSTILKIAVGGLRCLYAPMKLKKQREQIVIISRQSDHPTLDIRLLQEYMADHYPDVKCVTLCRKLEGKGAVSYGLHMLTQMSAMAGSKVILLDGYCIAASVLHHRPGTKVVQMWHALAAIKKFGFQTIDKPAGHSREIAEAMHMHQGYDHVIAPSEATGAHFCSCFNVDSSKLVYLALPRVDEILRPDKILPEEFRQPGGESFREHIRNEYNISEDREVLLYVPTFRKNTEVSLEGLIGATDSSRFTLVIKAHPLFGDVNLGKYADALDTEVQVIVDKKYTSYQWLSICDRVITDYSALGVEAALLDKPLYYYVYDIEDYKANVGLNVDPLVEMPLASAASAEELGNLLQQEYNMKQLQRFREKYVSVNTDDCTGRLAAFLTGLMK